ncbi:acetyl-CoA hydrolase/transferase family protein [Salipiger sp.]|uniref:acetyl-CoA hydrolase/transferase family protein n=1 Tax=Salipiger sp. TaxID=2078585 RepID=UPI003A98195A
MTPDLTLSEFIRPADTIMWGQAHAEPRMLIRTLIGQRRSIGRVRLFLGIGMSGLLDPDHADAFDFLSYCGSGPNRKLADAGLLDIVTTHYSRFPQMMMNGQLGIDVVFLQVPPPDSQGRYSLGMAREYLLPALDRARVIIGEVHPDVPWTFGGPYLAERDFTALVHSDEDLPESAPREIGAVEQAIGANVASLIGDGAVLQTGIGNIPDASLSQLRDRRDLGIHSGAIGDGLAMLCEAGAVTNGRKDIDAGTSIGGILMGGSKLRGFAHLNPDLALRGTDHTHNPRILGQLKNFVAINSAFEVDLTGQANSEILGGRYCGAVGGIIDFLRAAGASEGGIPIIALPASGRGASRIVPALSGPVSVPRSDAGVIVTEHGIADLRGLSLSQRARKMIEIAAPEHRDGLERHLHAQKGAM